MLFATIRTELKFAEVTGMPRFLVRKPIFWSLAGLAQCADNSPAGGWIWRSFTGIARQHAEVLRPASFSPDRLAS